jgi:predicted RND superfamily exporter protein
MVTDVAPVKHFGIMMARGTVLVAVSLLFLPCALAVSPTEV